MLPAYYLVAYSDTSEAEIIDQFETMEEGLNAMYEYALIGGYGLIAITQDPEDKLLETWLS